MTPSKTSALKMYIYDRLPREVRDRLKERPVGLPNMVKMAEIHRIELPEPEEIYALPSV